MFPREETLAWLVSALMSVALISLSVYCLGGSVPVFDEVVVSSARMNDVISLDAEAGMCSLTEEGGLLQVVCVCDVGVL